jgi:PIN domain nuclease of toxin-antitoxin system
MKLLLDTCTFLWIASESPRISKTAAALFMDRNNQRYLSAASAWEIGIKHASGRLPLPERPEIFVPKIREASGIQALQIDEESALHAAKLPALHSDPFDRMLIAQAIVHGMTILTPDPQIEQYAARVLW